MNKRITDTLSNDTFTKCIKYFVDNFVNNEAGNTEGFKYVFEGGELTHFKYNNEIVVPGVVFQNVSLKEVVFSGSHLSCTQFNNSIFDSVSFVKSNTEYIILLNSSLKKVSFFEADLYESVCMDSVLEDVDFSGAHIQEAVFRNVKFVNCIFNEKTKISDVTFESSTFENCTISPNINPANITYINTEHKIV